LGDGIGVGRNKVLGRKELNLIKVIGMGFLIGGIVGFSKGRRWIGRPFPSN